MLRIVIAALLVVAAASLATPRPFVSREVLQARSSWRAGDIALARRIAGAALPRLRGEVASSPADPDRHMALAEALALVDRPREALSEARTALVTDAAPTCPHSRRDGRSLVETMAIVAMEAGANDQALDAIEILLARGPPTEGPRLADDERFAPLRADPRFAKLLTLYRSPAAPTL